MKILNEEKEENKIIYTEDMESPKNNICKIERNKKKLVNEQTKKIYNKKKKCLTKCVCVILSVISC